MADRSLESLSLPLEVRARLAELELELSEGKAGWGSPPLSLQHPPPQENQDGAVKVFLGSISGSGGSRRTDNVHPFGESCKRQRLPLPRKGLIVGEEEGEAG